MRVDDIIDGLIQIFSNEPAFSDVNEYHKVIGIPPLEGTGINVGCDRLDCFGSTSSSDEVYASILVALYTVDANAESGEEKLHELAEAVRYCTNENTDLAGLVSSCTVNCAEFMSVDASGGSTLHRAVVYLTAQYVIDRKRTTPGVPVETINNDIDEIIDEE